MGVFKDNPELVLFASLALGYLVGKLRVGPLTLGGICGTLIVSLLFGAWTTLPAGPAALAAKSGAIIAPLAIRRLPDGRYGIEAHGEFTVPSSSEADLQRATQRIADALEATIAAAPEQWYSFKPMWPDDPAEARALEARAIASGGLAAPEPPAGASSDPVSEVASP